MEAASGLLLIAAAILALIINNSPLSWLYNGLLETCLLYTSDAADE